MNDSDFNWTDYLSTMGLSVNRINQVFNNSSDLQEDLGLVENYICKHLEEVLNQENPENIILTKFFNKLEELEKENEELKNRLKCIEGDVHYLISEQLKK